MKTPIHFIVVTLMSASAAFYYLNLTHPIQSKEAGALAPLPVIQMTTVNVSRPVYVTSGVKTVSEAGAVSEIAPHLDEVRAEMKKNPEVTPASLLLFASTMGKRFQIATLSRTNATAFFDELYSCLDDSKPIAITAKALCLRQGERLTHYYPVLRSNFDLLTLKASPEIRNLAILSHGSEKSSAKYSR